MRLLQLAVPLAVAVAASACHPTAPEVAVQPQIHPNAPPRAQKECITTGEEARRGPPRPALDTR